MGGRAAWPWPGRAALRRSSRRGVGPCRPPGSGGVVRLSLAGSPCSRFAVRARWRGPGHLGRPDGLRLAQQRLRGRLAAGLDHLLADDGHEFAGVEIADLSRRELGCPLSPPDVVAGFSVRPLHIVVKYSFDYLTM